MNEAQHGSRRDFVRKYLHNDHEASTASMRCPRSRRLTFLDLCIHRWTNIPEGLVFLSTVLRLVTFCCFLAVDVDQIPRDFLGE